MLTWQCHPLMFFVHGFSTSNLLVQELPQGTPYVVPFARRSSMSTESGPAPAWQSTRLASHALAGRGSQQRRRQGRRQGQAQENAIANGDPKGIKEGAQEDPQGKERQAGGVTGAEQDSSATPGKPLHACCSPGSSLVIRYLNPQTLLTPCSLQ